MEALKAELARKRKERERAAQQAETEGGEGQARKKKYVSRGELERQRLQRERQRERERELKDKSSSADGEAHERQGVGEPSSAAAERRGRGQESGGKGTTGEGQGEGEGEGVAALARSLGVQEVKRRLRLLKQPATLFGEGESDRYARLKRVERELVVEDTYAVGQQANTMLEIQKEEEAERRRMLRKEAARQEKNVKKSQLVLFNDADDPESEAERLKAAFKAAADKVAAEQREKTLPKGEAMVSYIKRMMAEWKAELDREAEETTHQSSAGGGNKQAMLQYRATEKSFFVLYERMEQSTLADDIKAALWLMVKSMKERNYLYASEIYVRLAIGNAPWPIGVTSVGIHDRSAREKISFAMNGQAHIMNDEATRKFIHGFKRLMTWVQKVYPTDPSRCLDFNSTRKDLDSLKAAEKRGEVLQLAAAPHFLGKDGRVKAPSKWENVLRHSGVKVGKITEQNKDKKESWITPDA